MEINTTSRARNVQLAKTCTITKFFDLCKSLIWLPFDVMDHKLGNSSALCYQMKNSVKLT